MKELKEATKAESLAMKKKPSKLLICSIVSLVIGLSLAYYGRGNILMMMFASLIFWLGFIPALVGFVICDLVGRKKESQLIPKLRSTFKIIMAVTIIQVITIPTGLILFSDDIEKAQAFCVELADKIEREKEKSGLYPSDIEALLKGQAKLPRFIDERFHYYRYDEGYELSFVVTGGLFPRKYTYSSKTGKWEILD